jgi:hypothetical protein
MIEKPGVYDGVTQLDFTGPHRPPCGLPLGMDAYLARLKLRTPDRDAPVSIESQIFDIFSWGEKNLRL